MLAWGSLGLTRTAPRFFNAKRGLAFESHPRLRAILKDKCSNVKKDYGSCKGCERGAVLLCFRGRGSIIAL